MHIAKTLPLSHSPTPLVFFYFVAVIPSGLSH
jgi:hypothetical protein